MPTKTKKIIIYSDWRNKAVGHIQGGDLITIGDLVATIKALRDALRIVSRVGKRFPFTQIEYDDED